MKQRGFARKATERSGAELTAGPSTIVSSIEKAKPRIIRDFRGWMCMGYGSRGKFCYAVGLTPRDAFLTWSYVANG